MKTALDALDPQLRDFVQDLCSNSARLGDGRILDWPQRRQIAEIVRTPWRSGGPKMAHTKEMDVDSAAGRYHIRVLRPTTAPMRAPALVYFHGGGWCMFSINTHDRLLREYAHAAGVVVVAIDYALAPEHPYPIALNQCVDLLAWLHAQAQLLDIDSARLALGGDSVGANLAVATALRLRATAKLQNVRALLLNYGAFNTVISAEATPLGTPDDLLTVAEMEEFWTAYLGPEWLHCTDPLAVPAHANLHDLPPALLVYGDRDVLGEQSIAMAQRLRQAGNVAELRCYSGAPHSFVEAMSVSHQARSAVAEGAAWLRRYLAPSNVEESAA